MTHCENVKSLHLSGKISFNGKLLEGFLSIHAIKIVGSSILTYVSSDMFQEMHLGVFVTISLHSGKTEQNLLHHLSQGLVKISGRM